MVAVLVVTWALAPLAGVLVAWCCGVMVPRVWRFDSIERQRSALRGLGWSSPAFFKKHAPSLSTLACHLRLGAVPVTLIRRPGEDGDPGRSYTSASRHAVVVAGAPANCLPSQDGCFTLRIHHNCGLHWRGRTASIPLNSNAIPVVRSACPEQRR